MALPDLIEIVPLTQPVRAEITVPGSKSITNRALILAALADGFVTLNGALWSEDTQVMTAALQKLGFEIKVEADPGEPCNRIITVKGLGGLIPNAGTVEVPLELFVGNAGTAARFLAAFVCLGRGVYRLSGVPRMHERPQAALFKALRELGYPVEAETGNDRLPVRIIGGGMVSHAGDSPREMITTRKCEVSIAQSSQFASALLLSARPGGWQVAVTGENPDESPYVAMTSKLMEVFPWRGGGFQIEPDTSSGSYFCSLMGFARLVPDPIWSYDEADKKRMLDIHASIAKTKSLRLKMEEVLEAPAPYFQWWQTMPDQIGATDPETARWLRNYWAAHSCVVVSRWPGSDWQIDTSFVKFLCLPAEISRKTDLGDSIMTAIVLAPFGKRPVKFKDLGRLRVQECERVVALRTELTRCGGRVEEAGDMLTIHPSPLHGAEIETYDDHRMAMCFAILGLKVPGIKIKNPACVKKTFPNFFQKFAAPPPAGLGVEIWEVKNGERARKLGAEDLFAD